MFLEMSIEVRLLAKAAIAPMASERPLLVVDVADVPLQIGGDGETPLAVLALNKKTCMLFVVLIDFVLEWLLIS